MTTYFNFMFQVFSYGVLGLGALSLVLLILFGFLWTASQILTSRKYWFVLAHATVIRMHGMKEADRYFWRAIDERAAKSAHEAQLIMSRASKHLPSNAVFSRPAD